MISGLIISARKESVDYPAIGYVELLFYVSLLLPCGTFSIITQFTAIFHGCKNVNFQMKNYNIFLFLL